MVLFGRHMLAVLRMPCNVLGNLGSSRSRETNDTPCLDFIHKSSNYKRRRSGLCCVQCDSSIQRGCLTFEIVRTK